MQVTYKFRLYPKKEDEKKLLGVLEICRLLYNSFLAIWNDSEKISPRYKLQAMLPKMKEEKEGLKKRGRKVGKLRYKKYGQFKSFILNQSDLNISGIVKNHSLAQSILDASWSKFFGRDYNASLNILERGMAGQGLPFVPSEVEPLRKLIPISASSIVEVGSPLPCDSWG